MASAGANAGSVVKPWRLRLRTAPYAPSAGMKAAHLPNPAGSCSHRDVRSGRGPRGTAAHAES